MTKTYELIGIGNAVVDVIAQSSDDFLTDMGIEKGIMQLIDTERAETLYAAMDARVQTPGGSVANTIAGVGALGLPTAFIGRVNDDALGRFYASAMEEAGTDFVNAPVAGGDLPTSRSMIFVSPDGERSMNTYLGISTDLGPNDVPAETCAAAKIVFLEGYLFDKDAGKQAFLEASRQVRAAGGKAGMSISDPFCVDRHRADFLRMIEHELDFVVGNDAEITSLFETDDLEDALTKISGLIPLVVCTRGGDGVTLIRGDERVDVGVDAVTPVDATGAGDQFAAGFLYGLATGASLETCGRMGNLCAAEVISHVGPRPEADMARALCRGWAVMLEDGYHDIPTGKVASVVTHLEMHAPQLRGAAMPQGLEFASLPREVGSYRALFRKVGQDWLWFGRLGMTDAALAAILTDPDVHLFTLLKGGVPEALLELDFRIAGDCELAYFGLAPSLIGTGAGAWLMDEAQRRAFAGAGRFHVHTCTLDSPQALGFYIRSGFTAYRRQIEIADDPRQTGLLDPAVMPQLPKI